MTPPIVPLFTRSLKGWFSAKGFGLVVAAALLPLALTGAWVTTHRADVAITGLQWDQPKLTEGDTVHFTATVKNTGPVAANNFNASLAIGSVAGGQLFPVGSNDTVIDHLAPGESRTISLDWNASPGTLFVVATADTSDTIAEIDEFNNQNATPLVVGYRVPDAASAPKAPANLTGDANATSIAELSIDSITIPTSGDNRTIVAVIKNDGPNGVAGANVTLRVGQDFSGQFFAAQETTTQLDLASGESKTVDLPWTTRPGAYWVEAWVAAPTGTHDSDGTNNHATKSVVVEPKLDPALAPPKPPEKLTIKEFYLQVLELLHLRVLLPLVALFYAAGIVADEREKKTLGYILTRPTPRWVFPLLKFVASFLVAAAATVIGLVLTYLLLFGTTPQGGDIGFLTTPVLASLLTLFAYGALFTLLGVLMERPYLVGLAFVIGWENAAPIFVPWVGNLTLSQHLGNAIRGWKLDAGLQWLPTTDDSVRGLLVVLAAGAAFLVASAYAMKRKEFEL